MTSFRDARVEDVASIIGLYADDDLGSTRELVTDPPDDGYMLAFRQIDSDPSHRLVVVEERGEVVGTVQLSFLPHLVLHGGERAQIDAVRVRPDRRGTGLGEAMLAWAINEARERGCQLVQLTTSTTRVDARRFYERLGFQASHTGMKLALDAL